MGSNDSSTQLHIQIHPNPSAPAANDRFVRPSGGKAFVYHGKRFNTPSRSLSGRLLTPPISGGQSPKISDGHSPRPSSHRFFGGQSPRPSGGRSPPYDESLYGRKIGKCRQLNVWKPSFRPKGRSPRRTDASSVDFRRPGRAVPSGGRFGRPTGNRCSPQYRAVPGDLHLGASEVAED